MASASGEDNSAVYLSISDLMSSLMMFFMIMFITVLAQLQESRQQVIDRRQAVINALVTAFEKNEIAVESSEDGQVTFREEMLFSQGSAELTPEGKALLAQFAPIYAGVIFSTPELEEEVTRVILEGHTSSEGGEQYNLALSLDRARNVALAMFGPNVAYADPSHAERLKEKLYPAGRGPWDAAPEVRESDRKVVLRLQFKGEDMVAWMTGNKG